MKAGHHFCTTAGYVASIFQVFEAVQQERGHRHADKGCPDRTPGRRYQDGPHLRIITRILLQQDKPIAICTLPHLRVLLSKPQAIDLFPCLTSSALANAALKETSLVLKRVGSLWGLINVTLMLESRFDKNIPLSTHGSCNLVFHTTPPKMGFRQLNISVSHARQQELRKAHEKTDAHWTLIAIMLQQSNAQTNEGM